MTVLRRLRTSTSGLVPISRQSGQSTMMGISLFSYHKHKPKHNSKHNFNSKEELTIKIKISKGQQAPPTCSRYTNIRYWIWRARSKAKNARHSKTWIYYSFTPRITLRTNRFSRMLIIVCNRKIQSLMTIPRCILIQH